jgi:hypothetical protein
MKTTTKKAIGRKKASKSISPQPAAEAAPPPEMVEVFRTCDKNLRSHGGFQWPESGSVSAPDWNPAPICGNGLHGLLEGQGSWGLLDWSIEARGMIVETERGKVVQLGGKVKFQTGIVKRLVSLAEGLCYFITSPRIRKQVDEIFEEAKKGNDPLQAASGVRSNLAASGDYSNLAASGVRSNLAASGVRSKLAASGADSKLAASGDYSNLAASGVRSKLAASGADSIVMGAGYGSCAKAVEGGVIALTWNDGTRPRVVVGYVGEDGIEADTWYRGDAGKLVKA